MIQKEEKMGGLFSSGKKKKNQNDRKKLGKGGTCVFNSSSSSGLDVATSTRYEDVDTLSLKSHTHHYKFMTTGEITSADRAKFQLKAASKNLRLYQKKLEKEIETNKERARKMLKAKKKNKALFFLKINKFKTKRIGELQSQLLNLEKVVLDLKTQEDNLDVFNAMKTGSAQLKKLQKQMPVDQVQQLMDDNAQSAQYMEELGQILGGEMSAADEDEVAAEFAKLEELEADEVMTKLPDVPTDKPVILPDVPTNDPVIVTKVTEKEEQKEKVRVAVPA